LHGRGRGFDIEVGGGPRGEFNQDIELRLRTPEALSERGRDELTGTKDSELVRVNGSGVVVRLNDDVAAVSAGAVGAIRTWDCDIGVPSEDSDSLSAVEATSICNEAVGVRSRSSLVLLGLNSGITRRCGGSVCARTCSRSACSSLYPHLRTFKDPKSCSLQIGFLQARQDTFHLKLR
jgi:hypothetical protein